MIRESGGLGAVSDASRSRSKFLFPQMTGQCSRPARVRHAFRASTWRWLAVLLLALGATGQAWA